LIHDHLRHRQHCTIIKALLDDEPAAD